jgi:hypothetical protein
MDQETLFRGPCLALDESPAEGNPFAGRFANQDPVGLAHYTGRNFERPFISYSVISKIDHR